MKKTIKTTTITYLIYWIIVLLLTSAKGEPIVSKHFEISLAILIIPLYLGYLTIFCNTIKKMFKRT